MENTTYQMKDIEVKEKVNQVIETLSNLDSGDSVDGETFDYIIKKLGFDDYLYTKYLNQYNLQNNLPLL